MNKNYLMVGLTILVLILIVWRHKTCPSCQKNLKDIREKVTG